MDDTESRLDSW